jgi:hypothetical protein
MATATRFKQETEWRAYVYKVKTWIYDKVFPDRTAIGKDGMIEIEYSEDDAHSVRKIVKFPVVSVWVDPSDTTTRNTCKVAAYVPKKATTVEEQAMLDFAGAMKMYGPLDHHARPVHTLSVDMHGNVLRYGAKESVYLTSTYSQSGYNPIPIYDNKAIAFTAIIEALRKYSTAKIAGLDLINLDSISDHVLEELGFVKVPDLLGRGVPMWMGDAVNSLSMGQASYSDQRWGSGRDDGTDKSTKGEVVESFLSVLEAELSAV